MTSDPEVTAIITTLDNLFLLQMQLPILLEECGQVVVVVNGSVDGSWEWLRDNPNDRLSPVFKLNEGAGPGRNRGLAEWDKHPTPYTLMLDGGILPLRGGIAKMKQYLLDNLDVEVVSPEVATSFVTSLDEADRIFMGDIMREHCFPQRSLSSTAYALCRASAWRVRFSEEGPFGMAGWGVDDNDMAYRWNEVGVMHHDFILPIHIYRHRSGSFKRLQNETGVPANGYGSVYEMRNVKLWQDWPQYMQYTGEIEVSAVICAWNEYPMVARLCKLIHEDLRDIPHEIIVVNNGSTDETHWWLNTFALRQPNGDTTVDAATGKVLQRKDHPELEPVWTGDIRRIDFPENVGISRGTNAAFDAARGKYIFLADGDMLIVRNSLPKLLEALKDLESRGEGDWVEVNPWVCQGDNDTVPPVSEDFTFIGISRNGLGDYAGGYALFNRRILDAGCRHPTDGPFEVVGAGYEDSDLANQMYSKGFKGWIYNTPGYYHKRRDFHRSGHAGSEADKFRNLQDRCDRVLARWVGSSMLCAHWHEQPPHRHVRRVAMVSSESDPTTPGTAYFALWALRKICEADIYVPGSEPEGYDDYLYMVDYDGDVPVLRRPATLWAIDLYEADWLFAPPKQRYLDMAGNFDRIFAAHSWGAAFFKEHGFNAAHLPLACWPELHHPCPDVPRDAAWVFVGHNTGPRPELFDALNTAVPNGLIAYSWGQWYSPVVTRGYCTVNKSRLGEMTLRVFENMAMGVPLVTDRVPELAEYFKEGEHYLGYDTAEELIEQVRWVQANHAEADAMAARARALVMSRHTYYHRMLRMFGER